jgi:hypothetical protein
LNIKEPDLGYFLFSFLFFSFFLNVDTISKLKKKKKTLWWTGEWFNGDVMAIINDALATGGDPNISDAFTINGQPGDFYNCSNGMLYKEFISFFFSN